MSHQVQTEDLEQSFVDALNGSLNDITVLESTAAAFEARFNKINDIVDLDKAISLRKSILSRIPNGDEQRPARLGLLIRLFMRRVERQGELADVESAISAQQEALALTPENHPSRPSRQSNLGNLLMQRFDLSGNIEDVSEAINSYNQSVSNLSDASPQKPMFLNCLGISYMCRFEQKGDASDIDQAVLNLEQALSQTPDSRLSLKLRRSIALGNSMMRRFEQVGNMEDIDRAILVLREAVAKAPAGDAWRPELLSNLGNSLTCRFERLRSAEDINEAISVHSDAIRLTIDNDPTKAARLSNLGNSLSSRFEHFGDIEDIRQAIASHKQALTVTPANSPKKAGRLNNLGHSLTWLFKRLGKPADVDKATIALDQAVRLTPLSHANLPMYLINLGTAYACRFERLGKIHDIDNAISAQKRSVALTPDSHSSKPFRFNALGNSYMRRFEWLGDVSDINRAISAQEEAVKLVPQGHVSRPALLNSLGNSYMRRFGHGKDIEDIAKATDLQASSIELIPDSDTEKPMFLNNLGSSLMSHFERLYDASQTPKILPPPDVLQKARELIDRAISAQKRAVELTPDGHAQKPGRLNNLGTSLMRRFELPENQVSDIDSAISYVEQAIQLTPRGHPDRPMFLNSLGGVYTRQSEHAREKLNGNGLDAAVKGAIEAYRQAAIASAGSPKVQFDAAKHWAKLSYQNPSVGYSPLEAYEVLVNLIPRIVWLGKSVEQRYQDICLVGTSVNEAAAVACELGNYELGLEWLEQGRSLIWGQILHLRTPVDDLREKEPALANELEQVAQQLENAGVTSDIERVDGTNDVEPTMEEISQAQRRLAESWERLLHRARDLDGFQDFLQPRKFSTLKQVAQHRAVVMVNVDKLRTDALIIKPGADKVEHLHLPKISYRKVYASYLMLLKSLRKGGIAHRGPREKGTRVQSSPEEALEKVLKTLWTDVAQPILDYLGYLRERQNPLDLPHVTWCLTGPLVFLPLHAAGTYDQTGTYLTTFKCVVSSYTPSLTALLELSKIGHKATLSSSVLAITQPATPDQPELPHVMDEVANLVARLKNKKVLRLHGNEATVAAVHQEMDKHSWIHMACHAIQAQGDPTKSGFLLEDGTLHLQAFMKKRIKNGELAFLSACQTASGDDKLPEESVHLAAGMLMAGFRSVVATMWSIRDRDAPIISDAVYSYLENDTTMDDRRVAMALHLAVARLREDVGEREFLSWVPYVHIGV